MSPSLRPDGHASRVLPVLADVGLMLAVAESLTGGLLASRIAAVPGASAVFRGGVVTYATDLKRSLLGVDEDLLRRRGAVDPQVAGQMATGVARLLGADVTLATTGVAGPARQDGHEVGTVFVACAHPNGVWVRRYRLAGSRQSTREAVVNVALVLLSAVVAAQSRPLVTN